MGHYLFLYLFNSINKKKTKKYSKNLKRRVVFIQKNQNISSTSIIYRFIIMFGTIVVCLLLREKKKERIFIIKDFNTKRYKLCLKGVI